MLNILKEEIKMDEIYKNLDLNDIEGEIWLSIEGYEELYEVSNMGRIKSLNYNHTKEEKILRQGKTKNGYLMVILCKEGKRKTFLVHRLVATAFLENPNGYRCVNHKNEIKTDNRVENLEPCTYKYNINFGTCIQRRVEKQSKKVYQYDKDGVLIAIWESTRECDRSGFDHSAVASCCRGNRKSHKNYIWSYTPIHQK